MDNNKINIESYINSDYNELLTENLINEEKKKIEIEEDTKYDNINNKINIIKEQMLNNIEDAINRKDNINEILDVTDNLQSYSLKFNDNSIQLKKKQCISYYKCYFYIFIILIFVIFLIVLISCKFNFNNC